MTWVAILSVCLNIYLVLYVRWLLKMITELTGNMGDLKYMFRNFKDHVVAIHESEMFYGDSSLQNLIKHSKAVLEELEQYEGFIEYDEEAEAEEEGRE